MGYHSTQAHADAIQQGYSPLSVYQLHLTTNFYPPLPAEYAEYLMDAVERVAQGWGSDLIGLPKDINPLPADAKFDEHRDLWMVPARYLVDVCRAWPFVEAFLEEEFEEEEDTDV